MSTPEIDFEAIKRTISLSEVLLSHGIHVPHRIKYRISCPLHGGDGPNFAVDEDRGLYHCFKCEAGGDVVTLLSELDSISIIEAGRRLTSEYKITSLGGSRSFQEAWNEVKKWEPKGPLPEIELPPNTQLTSYRGFSFEALLHFGLRLHRAGILIPCRDASGRMVGYSIRQTSTQPKYLNSTDFKKSEVLYGLYQNLDAIKRRRIAIICEGQFSAIRVWDSGYHNVVATLGATMSPAQARLLAPYVEKVVVLYDGDYPDPKTGKRKGEEGAKKIQEMYTALFRVEIKTLPEGEDPDTADLRILNNGE